jgi:hypothetical protein
MIPAAVACVALFAGSVWFSYRLAGFLAECDRRDAERLAVAEAERIVRHAAYGIHPSTWPKGDRP